jgi:hypothetical protein
MKPAKWRVQRNPHTRRWEVTDPTRQLCYSVTSHAIAVQLAVDLAVIATALHFNRRTVSHGAVMRAHPYRGLALGPPVVSIQPDAATRTDEADPDNAYRAMVALTEELGLYDDSDTLMTAHPQCHGPQGHTRSRR